MQTASYSPCFVVWLGLLLAVGGLTGGCSRAPFPVAPTRGVVLIDDKPLPGGRIMFAPVAQGQDPNAGKPAFGDIQPDGSFQLTTFAHHDGAVVGEHWVTLIGTKQRSVIGESPKETAPPLPFARVSVPTKQTVVPDTENELKIQLTSQQIRQFDQRDH